jgi:hypothetical protein
MIYKKQVNSFLLLYNLLQLLEFSGYGFPGAMYSIESAWSPCTLHERITSNFGKVKRIIRHCSLSVYHFMTQDSTRQRMQYACSCIGEITPIGPFIKAEMRRKRKKHSGDTA